MFFGKIIGLLKSIVLNLWLFPLDVAIKLPLLVGNSLQFKKLNRGSIVLPNQIEFGMIKIGTDSGSYGIECNTHSYLSIDQGCKVIFKGKARFAKGISIRCDQKGIIQFGRDVSFNQNAFIASNSMISIGDDVLGGANIVIRDCDGHPIYSLIDGTQCKGVRPIEIGNHVWIGSNATLMKGCKIGADSIVGWGSIVTHDYGNLKNSIIAGSPARIVKKDIKWEH